MAVAKVHMTASLVIYKPNLSELERTLNALHQAVLFAYRNHPLCFELTLVDNSNDAGWAENIKNWLEERASRLGGLQISLLDARANLGYGRGNNLVIDKISSDYHLVINPDLYLKEDALNLMLDFMQSNREVGLLVPAIYDEEGRRQYLCKRNPTLRIMFLRSFAPAWMRNLGRSALEHFEMRDCDYTKEIEDVQYPTGCGMFFRTHYLLQIRGFDPDYFLHYEDADIGRRLSLVAKSVYVPTVMATHGWSRGTHNSWRMRLITMRSGLIYLRKWGGIWLLYLPVVVPIIFCAYGGLGSFC